MTVPLTYVAALGAFLADPAHGGWAAMTPFADGRLARISAALDDEVARGIAVAPSPGRLFAALMAAPPEAIKVVILGQDPYPTPGHANGLAFSYLGPPPLPRSLGNIHKELAADLGVDIASMPVRDGDLSPWARQGVLLLNTALSVRAGAGGAGSHLALGWQEVTDALLRDLLARPEKRVLILWGASAQKKGLLADPGKHFVIASAHPSPLSARRGFFGSRPFSRANAWLQSRGLAPIAWA